MIVLNKDEKSLFYFALFIVGAIVLINILKKYQLKKQESNYVMPRGFFSPTPAPVPPPAPPAPPAPPVNPVARPVDPLARPVNNPTPPYPYPMPYPYPIYDFAVQPYVMVAPRESAKQNCYKSVRIKGDDRETCFVTKNDYVTFLKRSYNTFVDGYKDSLSTFRFGKAVKISGVLRKIKSDIESEVGIL